MPRLPDSSPRYQEVHVIRDPDGVVIVITQKIDDGLHSFAFMKEYMRDGKVVRSGFLHRRHSAAVRRLLGQAEEWLDRAIEQGQASRAR